MRNVANRSVIDHSALYPCPVDGACSKCFNNITDPRGFTLMLTPKCATQSIVEAYQQSNPHFLRFRSAEFVRSHCHQHFIAAFVRNPFDRLVSVWANKCLSDHRTFHHYGIDSTMDFDAFARAVCEVKHAQADKHFKPYYHDIGYMQPFVDYIVRFETLAQSWASMRDQLFIATGVRMPPLAHRNKSRHDHYQDYYTPDLIELVGNYYHDDIIEFGYHFDDQQELFKVSNDKP